MSYALTFDHGIVATEVRSWAINQTEGNFATLELVVKNPRVPLLSGMLWATFSRNATVLFYGRLVGVPEDMQANTVRLVFLARPDTYDADKAALAETLKVAPFWDPVWIAPERRTVPDEVLEARPYRWHIDRVTHALTISHIIDGEAGTVTISPDDVWYDSLKVAVGTTPADTLKVKAEIHWRQKANGEFNLTWRLNKAFKDASSWSDGYIRTYTGAGFVSSWPKTGTNFGGGWEVGTSELYKDDGETKVLSVDFLTGGLASDSQPPLTGGIFPINRGTPPDVEFAGNNVATGDGLTGGFDP